MKTFKIAYLIISCQFAYIISMEQGAPQVTIATVQPLSMPLPSLASLLAAANSGATHKSAKESTSASHPGASSSSSSLLSFVTPADESRNAQSFGFQSTIPIQPEALSAQILKSSKTEV